MGIRCRAYPFPFRAGAAFAGLNGLFFYLMRAPTALGRPIMDQLAGLKLYLETAESDRLNMQAPEITAERFEALLPYAVALNVEKPWSDAFAAALRRAHPGRCRPDAATTSRSGTAAAAGRARDFGSSVASTVGEREQRVRQRRAGVVRLVGLFLGGGGGGSGGGGGGGGGGGW